MWAAEPPPFLSSVWRAEPFLLKCSADDIVGEGLHVHAHALAYVAKHQTLKFVSFFNLYRHIFVVPSCILFVIVHFCACMFVSLVFVR